MTENEHEDQLLLERLKQREETEVYMQRRNRQRKKSFLYGCIIGILISIGYLYYFGMSDSKAITVLTAFGTLGVFVFLAFEYLQPSSGSNLDSKVEDELMRIRYDMHREVANLGESLGNPAKSTLQFTESDRTKVLSSIQAKLESEGLQSYVAGIKELV